MNDFLVGLVLSQTIGVNTKMEQSSSALLLAQRVAKKFSQYPQVEAVVLAGSVTNKVAEAGSDIDLYVYFNADIPVQVRKEIASSFASTMEINNQFWESGDEWIDEASGIQVDLMFRHTKWIEEQLERVLLQHQASIGYSTCFWHNVLTSTSLFDKNAWFQSLQIKANQAYPNELQRNIIAKNYPILANNLSSYSQQLAHAIRRKDRISINHRISALLASYFDILFALNKVPHPGEKRLLQLARAKCQYLPDAMETQLATLLSANDADVLDKVHELVDGLTALLKRLGHVTA